ncbi:MAG TPA: DNA-processing protein DprA [Tepidisphaeraceae bacterium]|nr:DNA-processing protein DprA [Tepidisphaeraceae bacterium]
MGLIHWLTLSLTPGIGPILTRRIVDATGSAAAACEATLATLRNIEGIGTAKADKIFAGLRSAAGLVQDQLDRAAAAGATIVCPDDALYPFLLREIPDPPSVLYVKGTLQPRDLHAVAIVGSRKCSHYGREQAERFAALLAGAGVCVISGGARGIDSAAHRGALSHPNGRTLAVLGSGIDVPYPPENANLFVQIAQRGAVISEYPMGTPPTPENFPKRNRVVSGMSRGVLVIEADERSGALITARQAIEDHNRTVFALPGRVDNAMSLGPHKLIREGATLVRNLEDILEELPPLSDAASAPAVGLFDAVDSAPQVTKAAPTEAMIAAMPVAPPADIGLSDRQRLLLAQLDAQPQSIDQLIDRSSLAANVVLQELTLLSLRGLAKRVDGQTYVRGRAR